MLQWRTQNSFMGGSLPFMYNVYVYNVINVIFHKRNYYTYFTHKEPPKPHHRNATAT